VGVRERREPRQARDRVPGAPARGPRASAAPDEGAGGGGPRARPRQRATRGTAGVLERAGIAVERVAKVSEGEDNVVGLIRDGAVDLVINTPFGRAPRSDGSFTRPAPAAVGVPCITTLPGVFAAVRGIEALRGERTEP